MKANPASVRNTLMTFSLPIVAIPRETSCASFMHMTCHKLSRVTAY